MCACRTKHICGPRVEDHLSSACVLYYLPGRSGQRGVSAYEIVGSLRNGTCIVQWTQNNSELYYVTERVEEGRWKGGGGSKTAKSLSEHISCN
jgi:hypothetical protein